MEPIRISVRNLVEFVLRQGSIDARYMGASRAAEGTRLHQKLQKYRKKQALLEDFTYESEVSFKLTIPFQGLVFQIEGRADGILNRQSSEIFPSGKSAAPPDFLPVPSEIFPSGKSAAPPDFLTVPAVTIEEIKSTVRPLAQLSVEPDHWHWAQAKCYGFLYCLQNPTENLTLMLTYISAEENDWISFEETYTREQLATFFYSILEKYEVYAKMDMERIQARNTSVKALAFPYDDYRKGQRDLAVAIYKTIYGNKKIFVQAPTGTGKTISALFPAVKSLGEGLASKIFYLTAKTITRQTAEEAFALMEARGLSMRVVTLTAKDKICFLPDASCTPESCLYAEGHFDRVNEAILELIPKETNILRTTIERYAQRHRVCPYEFSLDLALFCDCVVCDYNYAYDPTAQLKRFFANGPRDYLLLHDEAHNLVDRSRQMFSAELSYENFSKARKALKTRKGSFYKVLGKGMRFFDALDQEMEPEERVAVKSAQPEELYFILRDLTTRCDEWLLQNQGSENYEDILSLYFLTLDFLRTAELFDERFIVYIEGRGKHMRIKLLCLDSSALLAQTQEKVRSSLFFSATLTPLDYFKESLGGSQEDYGLLLSSPFDKKNLCLLMETSISTFYKNRAASYEPVADCLNIMGSAKTGNYLIFFSSYEYLEGVWNFFVQKYPGFNTLVQEKSMTEEEREDFLKQFSHIDASKTLLGFAVLGGLFSEGIDLTGDKLIGVAVVGVGLPMITPEREALSAYYREKHGQGFEYAYVYPGMNKVLQAAGRVIRTQTDRGVVLLIDSRYGSSAYKGLFPPEWGAYEQVRGIKRIEERLGLFWGYTHTQKDVPAHLPSLP